MSPPFRITLGILLLTGTAAAADRRLPPAAHAERVVATIAGHAREVRTELRYARSRGDRLRARCLSGKLTEIHAQQRQANDRRADLIAAEARGDTLRVTQNRVVLSALGARSVKLARQAKHCGV